MIKRRFKLPGIQDLSKEQEDARALPKKGKYLIIGGPGTGKSVLALFRSRRYYRGEEDYLFLVYNHLLNKAGRQLFGGNLKSETWIKWFRKFYQEATGEKLPQLPKQPGNEWQEIDWDAVEAVIADIEELPDSKFPYLVIDEGQDMPPSFYKAVYGLGFDNIFVVADQNQQIDPDKNSTRQEIQNRLLIKSEDIVELMHNYRNTYPVARLAREFYTDDPASPPPDLPKAQHSAKRPILFEYKHNQFKSLIVKILKIADLNPGWLIGVIAPKNSVRKRYYDALLTVDVQLDNGRPRVSTYYNGAELDELKFCLGGIMVINAQSCKGLEFNIVFLADINEHYFNPGISDQKKRLFYVMIARAMDRVIMLKEADKPCPVEPILPKDPEILERI